MLFAALSLAIVCLCRRCQGAILAALISLSLACQAQTSDNLPPSIVNKPADAWSVAANWAYGRIIRHNKRFRPEVTESSDVWELNLSRHLSGKRAWQMRLGYPVAGISLLYARMGNADIFGNAYGALLSVMFQSRWRNFALQYRLGTGLAYVTKHYHPVSNPTNNVIGSHVNNVTQAQIAAQYNPHPRWGVSALLSFTHFSNGRTQTPNLGINIGAYGLGLRYMLQNPTLASRTAADSVGSPRYNRRWHLGLTLGQGIQEADQAGGPKFGVYVGRIYVAKRISLQWQLHAGLAVDYYTLYAYLGVAQGLYSPDEAAAHALKITPYVAGELLLGRVSLYGSLGVYAYNRAFRRGNIPTKIGLQYYPLQTTDRRTNKQLYVGVYLKSLLAVADYTELGLGYVF